MIADKKSKKKFMEKMSTELQGADNVKNMYVTPDGYLYFYWPNGYMAAYKKWKLSDIWYVAVYKDTFGVYDENMKPLHGEYISQSKGKGTGGVNFPVGCETARAYADFIKQHDPRIQSKKAVLFKSGFGVFAFPVRHGGVLPCNAQYSAVGRV